MVVKARCNSYAGGTPSSSENCLLWEMQIQDAGEALLIVLSPDQKSIAIQQDERCVQFIDRASGNMFVEVSPLTARVHVTVTCSSGKSV